MRSSIGQNPGNEAVALTLLLISLIGNNLDPLLVLPTPYEEIVIKGEQYFAE